MSGCSSPPGERAAYHRCKTRPSASRRRRLRTGPDTASTGVASGLSGPAGAGGSCRPHSGRRGVRRRGRSTRRTPPGLPEWRHRSPTDRRVLLSPTRTCGAGSLEFAQREQRKPPGASTFPRLGWTDRQNPDRHLLHPTLPPSGELLTTLIDEWLDPPSPERPSAAVLSTETGTSTRRPPHGSDSPPLVICRVLGPTVRCSGPPPS